MDGMLFANFGWYCDKLTVLFNIEYQSDDLPAMAGPELRCESNSRAYDN